MHMILHLHVQGRGYNEMMCHKKFLHDIHDVQGRGHNEIIFVMLHLHFKWFQDMMRIKLTFEMLFNI